MTVPKRIGKEYIIRRVVSSFTAVRAVWHSFPALAQHFFYASKDEIRQSNERAKSVKLPSKKSVKMLLLKIWR